jgi:Cyclic phosphodiesterase-like protein
MATGYPTGDGFQTANRPKRRFVNRRSLFHLFRVVEKGEEIVTYWLCPAESERIQFARLIVDLAERFDAPVFEPHVTIHVTSAGREDPGMVLEKTVKGRRPYRLSVRELDYSDKYTKTLFVQLAPDASLTQLSEDLRRASVSPGDYQLNPHISLLYKTMDEETKRRLAASIILPFTAVNFCRVKAVLSPAEIKSRADVEAWRVIAECSLTA